MESVGSCTWRLHCKLPPAEDSVPHVPPRDGYAQSSTYMSRLNPHQNTVARRPHTRWQERLQAVQLQRISMHQPRSSAGAAAVQCNR